MQVNKSSHPVRNKINNKRTFKYREMKKAIVIFSGGPDSTAAALWAQENGYDPQLVTFKFSNDQQDAELNAAACVATHLGLTHGLLDFTSPMASFSNQARALMHIGVPRGSSGTDKPHLLAFGAGMVLSTIACYALYHKIYTVIWGATKDDSYLNTDYTKAFSAQMAVLVQESGGSEFNILTPFFHLHKYQVLAVYCDKIELFADTLSCLFPVAKLHCGRCKACISRRTAAKLAKLKDITNYIEHSFESPVQESKLENPEILTDADFRQIVNSGTIVDA
jgi:7-cyano-7-deazaguanine synthase